MKRFRKILPDNFRLVSVWIISVSKGVRRRMLTSCAVGICEVTCSLGFVWGSKSVIDIATGAKQGSLWEAACFTGIFLAVQLFFSAVDMWLSGSMPVDAGNLLRRRLFDRLLRSRWNELERFHTGDVINRIVQDVTEVVRFVTTVLPAVFVTGVQLLASFVFFCLLDASLAWLLAAVIPLFLLISKFYMGKMRRYTHDIRKSDSRIQAMIQESLQHRVVIKAMQRDAQRIGALESMQTSLRGQVMRKTRLSLFSRIILGLGFNFGYLLVFLWGAVRLSMGSISFGTMTAFLQLVGRVQRPALDLTRLFPSFITAYTAAERLMEIESLSAEAGVNPVIMEGKIGIRFDNVTFAYEEKSKKVIDALNLDLKPGTVTAIVGETGAGKTTLIRLILALTDPVDGKICLYNETKEVEVSPDTRVNLVYVPQGNTLFSGSIKENLLLGNPDATDEELRIALEIAVAGFVFQLPGGVDTLIGESGSGLSEGQAQRIAIARALLRPGGVLLFDEATSALDMETESELLNNLRSFCAGKTIVFITHHRYLARECDLTFSL